MITDYVVVSACFCGVVSRDVSPACHFLERDIDHIEGYRL